MTQDPHDSESAAQRDIAAVNLLRLRGDLDQAKQLGAAMLKRHPNDASLYELMGAIHLDLGEREQAVQWWEMALDIDPTLHRVRSNVESVKAELSTEAAADTATRLGIPQRQSRPWALVAATVAGAGLLAYGAYVAGNRARPAGEEAVQPPVLLSKEPTAPPPAETPEPQEPRQQESPAAAADAALLSSLTGLSDSGVTFLSASHDPRGPVATLTVAASGEALAVTALRAALAAHRADGRYASFQVRVVRDREIVYLADAARDALAAASAAIAGGDSLEAQVEVVLTRQWPPGTAGATTPPEVEAR